MELALTKGELSWRASGADRVRENTTVDARPAGACTCPLPRPASAKAGSGIWAAGIEVLLGADFTRWSLATPGALRPREAKRPSWGFFSAATAARPGVVVPARSACLAGSRSTPSGVVGSSDE